MTVSQSQADHVAESPTSAAINEEVNPQTITTPEAETAETQIAPNAPSPAGNSAERVSDERARQQIEQRLQQRINLMRTMMLQATAPEISGQTPGMPTPPGSLVNIQMLNFRLPQFRGLGLKRKLAERRVERALENYTMMLSSMDRIAYAANEYNRTVSEKYPEYAGQLKHYAEEYNVTEDRIAQMLKDPSVDQAQFVSSDGTMTLSEEMHRVANDRELDGMRKDMKVDIERLATNMNDFTAWSEHIKNKPSSPEQEACLTGIMDTINRDIREPIAAMDTLNAEDPEEPGMIENMRDRMRNMFTKLLQTVGKFIGFKPKNPHSGPEVAEAPTVAEEAPAPTPGG
ncbi:hypothetical protein CSR02_14525 [Acetobacter pomorum]|uniref:Uncharacterized protein n=2 Tax=Acetobacter pomorum TaxID=65959 RepID=A0A2G4R8C7_9PROT|nr:hypothetical protein [Acetobacter pomorum]PHY92841.1 hypothetical protein CSR02_14525 [Acetobacter pomorum]